MADNGTDGRRQDSDQHIALGYNGIGVRNLVAWRTFATEEHFASRAGARFFTRDPGYKDLGHGHIVPTFPGPDEAREFYLGTLGFKAQRHHHHAAWLHSDIHAYINPRHHSLALLPAPPGAAPALTFMRS